MYSEPTRKQAKSQSPHETGSKTEGFQHTARVKGKEGEHLTQKGSTIVDVDIHIRHLCIQVRDGFEPYGLCVHPSKHSELRRKERSKRSGRDRERARVR